MDFPDIHAGKEEIKLLLKRYPTHAKKDLSLWYSKKTMMYGRNGYGKIGRYVLKNGQKGRKYHAVVQGLKRRVPEYIQAALEYFTDCYNAELAKNTQFSTQCQTSCARCRAVAAKRKEADQ